MYRCTTEVPVGMRTGLHHVRLRQARQGLRGAVSVTPQDQKYAVCYTILLALLSPLMIFINSILSLPL